MRAAAKIYNVADRTIRRRLAGQLQLSMLAFPPRLCGVEDMANQLLCVRDTPPVGKLWAHRFVKRQPELRTRDTRRYDYQRAKCGGHGRMVYPRTKHQGQVRYRR